MVNKKEIEEFEKLKKQRIKDEKEFKEFQISTLFGGIGDGLFIIAILLLDGYIIITEKVRWIIVVIVSIVVLMLYYLTKYHYKHEKKPEILSKK